MNVRRKRDPLIDNRQVNVRRKRDPLIDNRRECEKKATSTTIPLDCFSEEMRKIMREKVKERTKGSTSTEHC